MPNVIKQIVKDGADGTQTIRMIVRDNERGPQGEKGETGTAAIISAGQAYSVPADHQPAVINTGSSTDAVFDFYIPRGEKGEPGNDGAFYYKAGTGIRITDNNVINATGEAEAAWGGIIGDINDQTDLINLIDSKDAVWGNITGDINDQTDLASYIAQISPKNVWYGTCSTAEGTLIKEVTITEDFEYTIGDLVIVHFDNKESASSGVSIKIDNTFYTVISLPWSASSNQLFVCGQNNTMQNILEIAASTSDYGITKLYDGHNSSSTSLAATANSVKGVYDAIPTVNDSTISFTNNGAAVDSFTTNASSNKTIDFSAPVITMTTTDPGEGVALAENNFIAVYTAS